jgi:electron transfer flavoprotein beta subunit
MKIAVCVKRVPDPAARIRIAPDGRTIRESELKGVYVISPHDEAALEAAVGVRRGGGAKEVTAVMVGEAEGESELRTALDAGADRGVLLQARVGMDGLVIARTLAAWLAGDTWDLILLGGKPAGNHQPHLGPMLAELLGLPAVTAVTELEVLDRATGIAVMHRHWQGGIQVVEARMPAVVTITGRSSGAPRPFRRPILSSQESVAAKRRSLDVLSAQAVGDRVRVLRLIQSVPHRRGRIVGRGPEAVPELVRLLREDGALG